MSIQMGDPIPNARVFELDQQGTARAVSAAERFACLLYTSDAADE